MNIRALLVKIERKLVPQYAVLIRHENPDLSVSERPARAFAEDYGAVFNPLDRLFTFDNWDNAYRYSQFRAKQVRSDQNRYFHVSRIY